MDRNAVGSKAKGEVVTNIIWTKNWKIQMKI